MDKYYSEETGPQLRPATIWTRFQQVIDYLFFLLYGLVSLLIILELAGARESSGFKQFLNAVTYPFLRPFSGLFADLVFKNHHPLRISYLVALVVYLLFHLAVLGLFRLFGRSRSSV